MHNKGQDSWFCTCLSSGDAHDPECRCRCLSCTLTRSCPCTDSNPNECSCEAICNCSCEGCHKSNALEVPVEKTGEKRKRTEEKEKIMVVCEMEDCQRLHDSSHGSVCRYCSDKIRANRQCAAPDCTNLAPNGSDYGRFCKSCTEDKGLEDLDPSIRRMCSKPGCKNRAPRGSLHGNLCANHRSSRGWHATKNASTDRTKPCPKDGCPNTYVLGGKYGAMCEACYRVKHRSYANGRNAKLRAQGKKDLRV